MEESKRTIIRTKIPTATMEATSILYDPEKVTLEYLNRRLCELENWMRVYQGYMTPREAQQYQNENSHLFQDPSNTSNLDLSLDDGLICPEIQSRKRKGEPSTDSELASSSKENDCTKNTGQPPVLYLNDDNNAKPMRVVTPLPLDQNLFNPNKHPCLNPTLPPPNFRFGSSEYLEMTPSQPCFSAQPLSNAFQNRNGPHSASRMKKKEKPIHCQPCDKIFFTEKLFERHRSRVHPKVKCSLCPNSKLFKDHYALLQHMGSKHPGQRLGRVPSTTTMITSRNNSQISSQLQGQESTVQLRNEYFLTGRESPNCDWTHPQMMQI